MTEQTSCNLQDTTRCRESLKFLHQIVDHQASAFGDTRSSRNERHSITIRRTLWVKKSCYDKV